jgi:cold shock CspA family protein
METERRMGKIKWFSQKKGYGFLIQDGTKAELWFHVNQFLEQVDEKLLLQDLVVYFDLGVNFKGGCAVELSLKA